MVENMTGKSWTRSSTGMAMLNRREFKMTVKRAGVFLLIIKVDLFCYCIYVLLFLQFFIFAAITAGIKNKHEVSHILLHHLCLPLFLPPPLHHSLLAAQCPVQSGGDLGSASTLTGDRTMELCLLLQVHHLPPGAEGVHDRSVQGLCG